MSEYGDERIRKINHVFEIKEADSYLFSWDEVPGNDSGRLLRYLRTDLDIDWVESVEFSKSDNGKTLHIFKDKNSAVIMIDEEEEKATLKIGDSSITRDLKVKKENNRLNIYTCYNVECGNYFAESHP